MILIFFIMNDGIIADDAEMMYYTSRMLLAYIHITLLPNSTVNLRPFDEPRIRYYAVLLYESSFRSTDLIFLSALLSEQPSNVFTTVKITISIACILPKRHNLGLGTSAIVFYDLILGRGSLSSDFLGKVLIIDF